MLILSEASTLGPGDDDARYAIIELDAGDMERLAKLAELAAELKRADPTLSELRWFWHSTWYDEWPFMRDAVITDFDGDRHECYEIPEAVFLGEVPPMRDSKRGLDLCEVILIPDRVPGLVDIGWSAVYEADDMNIRTMVWSLDKLQDEFAKEQAA